MGLSWRRRQVRAKRWTTVVVVFKALAGDGLCAYVPVERLKQCMHCRYYHGSGLSGREAGEGPSGVATFGAGDTVGVGVILLPDPAYPVLALFYTLNGQPLGPEGNETLAQPWAE